MELYTDNGSLLMSPPKSSSPAAAKMNMMVKSRLSRVLALGITSTTTAVRERVRIEERIW